MMRCSLQKNISKVCLNLGKKWNSLKESHLKNKVTFGASIMILKEKVGSAERYVMLMIP